jgi:hypothetical protein
VALGLLAAALVSPAVVAATPAAASVPGLLEVSAQSQFDSSVYKAVTVFCPAGMRVVGGGYSLGSAYGAVVLDDFIPSADRVRVGAGEVVGAGEPSDGTTESWYVVAIAYCANSLPGYTIVNATSDYRTGSSRGIQANCPAGTVAIGGGASLANGFGQISFTDLRVLNGNGTSATASQDEDGYSDPWSITAYAICTTNGLPGLQTVFGFETPNSVALHSVNAYCPAGKVAIGGGAGVDINQAIPVELTTSTDNHTPGIRVWSNEDQSRYPGNWSTYAEAVCADR